MPEYSQTAVEFTPQTDITPYELAQCVQYLVNGVFRRGLVDKAYFDGLSTGITRHFTATEIDPPEEGGES